MLRLLGFWCWWAFSLAQASNTTTERSTQLYVQPHLSIGSCLDYCHFRYIPFLPCLDDSEKIASSPAKACGGGYCDAEVFELSYKTGDGVEVESRCNRVERTRLGRLANLRELCLDERGFPVRRRCEIRNGTRAWQSLSNITCRPGQQLSSNLNRLAVEAPPDMISRLSDLLRQPHEPLRPVDIFSIAQIFESLLEKPNKDPAVVSDLLGICRHVMASERETLRLSAELNATNTLLSNFEDYLDALPPQLVPPESCDVEAKGPGQVSGVNGVQHQTLGHMGVHALISNELSVFFVNPDCANVTGIAISTSDSDPSDFGFSPLSSSESLENIRARKGLQTAAFLPEPLWGQLKKRRARYLVFKVYTRDSLFVETKSRVRMPSSAVISISIPGMKTADNSLPLKLPFFLRSGSTNSSAVAGGRCGYWNYETWLSDGITICSSGSADAPLDPVILCHADHLTQFSFLLGLSKSQTGVDEYEDDRTLDIITNVGLSLSLVGLLAIFLTAALFRRFRSLASTKVLLNLCLALALQTLLFMDIGQGQLLGKLQFAECCLVAGALMQYFLLVVFSWMLIIGFLQFKRYVKVIGVTYPRHYIFMSALVAWTLPLIPTLLLIKLDPASYRPTQQSPDMPHSTVLCYPSGRGLYLGVVLPIALVTLANALMVGYITCSVYRALNTRGQHTLQQLRLFVLLFFLLGLTWIFGFCSYFQWGRVFSYLFCLTATLQGFVLFVYFIIINKDNRIAWLGLICNWKFKEELDIVALRTQENLAFSRTNQISFQSTTSNSNKE
ncbi:LOW QUALITY PROTEIN: adhesion G-protein coupled receptor G6 [Drosophila obscura]|uniref:LOW QUALITY PROTEIN: adhesion G-protein coupled receptor G6 n=1 Tax=Drosophila obscura TaxID=7282 RepID=UPI001BB18469|nr:LOW QUALITY PROTEIN: adhesion G-protein coupled receptor G6 [Drosophila obscura]